jgi:predicted dehydrogenase
VKAQPYLDELRAFIACAGHQSLPVVSLEDAASTLYLIDAAKKSARDGEKVTVSNLRCYDEERKKDSFAC